MAHDDLVKAADAIAQLGMGADLTARIGAIEAALAGKQRRAVERTIANDGVDESMLNGAITIKKLAGQINVVIHAVGILVALPHLLARDERIESVSLGAGNTGRQHDLVTDRRIAEFKFIDWRGGPESIRQNVLFIDLFNLASAETDKRRCMYVLGRRTPGALPLRPTDSGERLEPQRIGREALPRPVWREFQDGRRVCGLHQGPSGDRRSS